MFKPGTDDLVMHSSKQFSNKPVFHPQKRDHIVFSHQEKRSQEERKRKQTIIELGLEVVDVDAALVVEVGIDPAGKDLGVDGTHDVTLFETTSARRNHSTQTVVKRALRLHGSWCLVRWNLWLWLINRCGCGRRCRSRSRSNFIGVLLVLLLRRMTVGRSVPVLTVIFFLIV
jgi:hypothetical protein